MNEEPVTRPRRRKQFSVLRVFLGVLIGLTILAYLILPPGPPRSRGRRVVCLTNLRSLGAAVGLYAEEHEGVYPSAERWCDLLVDKYALEKAFKCPEGGKERCDYAMNPRADAHSAPDVVLLFESTGGWNQSGGPELLTTKHHEDKGCNVLFVDYHAEFVRSEDIPHLKWEGAKQSGTWPLVPSLLHH
jgi:hypothetical protein